MHLPVKPSSQRYHCSQKERREPERKESLWLILPAARRTHISNSHLCALASRRHCTLGPEFFLVDHFYRQHKVQNAILHKILQHPLVLFYPKSILFPNQSNGTHWVLTHIIYVTLSGELLLSPCWAFLLHLMVQYIKKKRLCVCVHFRYSFFFEVVNEKFWCCPSPVSSELRKSADKSPRAICTSRFLLV